MDKAITLGFVVLGIVFIVSLVIILGIIFPERFKDIMPDRFKYGDKEAEWSTDVRKNNRRKEENINEDKEGSEIDEPEGEEEEVIGDSNDGESSVIDLIKDKNYYEAIEIAKNNDNEYLTEAERIANAQFLAVQNGISEAFSDLRETYEDNKNSVVITGCMMGGHYYVGNMDKAIELADQAVEQLDQEAADIHTRIVLLNYSRINREIGRVEHAIKVLSERVEQMSIPSEISLVYREIAEAFTDKDDYNDVDVKSIQELSLMYDRDNASKRFNLAYEYDEESISLSHYNEIIRNGDDTSVTLNNAGVDADSLNMPGKSVDYYKEAKEGGNTLAVANIAKKLINEGFFSKAEELLSKARKKDDYHENIDKMIGKMSSQRSSEEELFNKIVDNFKVLTRWRSEYGKNILRNEIKNEELLGNYSINNHPFSRYKDNIDLELSDNNYLSFATGEDKKCIITKQGRGLRLKFYQGDYYHRSNKKGRGILVYKNGKLLGYFYYDEEDSSVLENIQEWRLEKV